eukprot:m.73869 g.73869  ORF g.73869 m.73869 type:complete len:444 (+) comp7746_c0_seq1:357-1688(+)
MLHKHADSVQDEEAVYHGTEMRALPSSVHHAAERAKVRLQNIADNIVEDGVVRAVCEGSLELHQRGADLQRHKPDAHQHVASRLASRLKGRETGQVAQSGTHEGGTLTVGAVGIGPTRRAANKATPYHHLRLSRHELASSGRHNHVGSDTSLQRVPLQAAVAVVVVKFGSAVVVGWQTRIDYALQVVPQQHARLPAGKQDFGIFGPHPARLDGLRALHCCLEPAQQSAGADLPFNLRHAARVNVQDLQLKAGQIDHMHRLPGVARGRQDVVWIQQLYVAVQMLCAEQGRRAADPPREQAEVRQAGDVQLSQNGGVAQTRAAGLAHEAREGSLPVPTGAARRRGAVELKVKLSCQQDKSLARRERAPGIAELQCSLLRLVHGYHLRGASSLGTRLRLGLDCHGLVRGDHRRAGDDIARCECRRVVVEAAMVRQSEEQAAGQPCR